MNAVYLFINIAYTDVLLYKYRLGLIWFLFQRVNTYTHKYWSGFDM